MVDIGRLQNGPLRLGELRGPFGQRGFVDTAGVVEVLGRIPVQGDPPVVLAVPGQGAVGGGLVEDHQVARLLDDVMDQLRVGLPGQDILGTGQVGLVAARDDAESARSGVHVRQGELAHDQAGAHASVVVMIVAGPVEGRVAGAVDLESLATCFGDQHVDAVVELPAASEQGVEIGNDLRMGQEVAERPAPRLGPGEHALVVPERRPRSLEGPAPPVAAELVGPVVGSEPAGIGVERFVHRLYFVPVEESPDMKEPLQVVQVLLLFAHGRKGRRFGHGAPPRRL